MKIISSELYVKDNKVYHEGNKPKPKDIGAAPETHTHNYASATTPGGSAEHAIKATEDSLGQRIDKYIKGLSVSGRTITYTRGDGTTGTITTQDNDTDTKVTNTLNTTAKAYITGTTDSATNTGTQVFDTNVYLDTTAGMLTATTFKGALQGNATTATSATSASHAAKLTTPRSINGTNFDGTAAITTANWGTARTLTIGNTGKSVNGSGNVSWSIGEIGAAPTVHNHTSLTGITNLSFAAEGTDSASITTTVEGANTYFDFNLSDDPGHDDMWRWRFRPNGGNLFNAMTLDAISTTEAKLAVTGEVQATRLKGTLTGDVKGNVTGTVSGNAGSATKLATPRTINGTNFDGTGNITTANWGTARNIQIGNAVKSVNGSANVTWTLGEIGAAASNHTHDSYVQGSNSTRTTDQNGNSNDIKASGFYRVSSTSSSTNIFPDGQHSHILHGQHPTTSGYAYQLAVPYTATNKIYFRNNPNSSWGAWNKIYHSGDKPTPSEIGAAASNHTHNYAGSSSAGGNANAAVKLATARSINGTNFDGSANITTANWGTARNIQIGNAVKSVNGSANVTWNWSEMQVPRAYSSSYSFGGNQNAITTAQFITMLTNLGAFSQVYWVSRGSWSYASNQYINDTGCGNIHLAGCVVEVIGNTSVYTIRVTTPTTTASGTTNAEFIYVNNGTDYSPGWRRQYNTKNKPTPSEIGAAAASHTHNYAGSSSAGGAANTAVKLATARTIALGGILSGSASFDGSGNVTINATANDITTITKSLKVTTSWMDTGITGSNLGTGTYAVQMYVNDGTNTSQYQEYYSGMMSWFNGTTNSTDADEILLHKAGHASNGRHVYLRTIRTSNSGYLKLQISCTHAFSAASSITFKFKKLI